ncbi:MAG: hypothetical protein IPJ07_23390 [Acidobacteria bacterium]|nr:hypothetical protein [Acidobacteriota bacterium]
MPERVFLAQTGGAAAGQVPKMKVAIIDVLSFRDQVTELKAKYDKLQTEFAPRYQQLESMQPSWPPRKRRSTRTPRCLRNRPPN